MRIYFTGMPLRTPDYLALMRGRSVMYSFLSRRRSAYRDLSHYGGVALDSSAYSVWKRAARVDLGRYADYCGDIADGLDWYANLDVIGDWRAGLANLAALEGKGLTPVPVFHLGEPWGLLEDFVLGYDRVAIARGPGMCFAGMWRLLEVIFDRYSDSEGTPLCRFHGFRMTDRRVMARFPFDSVDSTTWISGSAWDELPTDTGRARGFSFLGDTRKAEVWLSFFDAAQKAQRFQRGEGGLSALRTPAPKRMAYAF